jgi:ribonuclease VapC
MIVVDSSGLICVVAGEAQAEACGRRMMRGEILVSAATLAETRIVAMRLGLSEPLSRLVDGLDLEVIPVDEPFAARVVDAYGRWGKGMDPARLNYGDCFSYALAEMYDCPLLYIGDDFARTDIAGALD